MIHNVVNHWIAFIADGHLPVAAFRSARSQNRLSDFARILFAQPTEFSVLQSGGVSSLSSDLLQQTKLEAIPISLIDVVTEIPRIELDSYSLSAFASTADQFERRICLCRSSLSSADSQANQST